MLQLKNFLGRAHASLFVGGIESQIGMYVKFYFDAGLLPPIVEPAAFAICAAFVGLAV